MRVRFRFGRSRRRRCAGCSRGSARSFVLRCAPGGIESAPTRRRRRGRAEHKFGRRSCGARLATPVFVANSLTTCQASFSVTPSPQGLPALLTRRNTLPALDSRSLHPGAEAHNRPSLEAGPSEPDRLCRSGLRSPNVPRAAGGDQRPTRQLRDAGARTRARPIEELGHVCP